jgi:hypothetical protein
MAEALLGGGRASFARNLTADAIIIENFRIFHGLEGINIGPGL